jgi:hypothetical protein
MNPYPYLHQYPERSKSLIGIDLEHFSQLQQTLERVYAQERAEREWCSVRLNAPGGGRPPKLTLGEQICMTLVSLRHAPTFDLLGLLFDLSKTEANDTFHDWLPRFRTVLPASLLEQVEGKPDELDWVLRCLLEQELLVDSTEQPRYRPEDNEAQRQCYSGKKQQHTYKNQIVSLPNGRDIVDVLVGERGPEADVNLLRQQQAQFDPGQGFGGDKAYQGAPRTRTPHKKPRNGTLGETEREENRTFAKERIGIEHLIRVVKIFRIAQARFRGRTRTYREVILTVCGLVRLRLGMLILPLSNQS